MLPLSLPRLLPLIGYAIPVPSVATSSARSAGNFVLAGGILIFIISMIGTIAGIFAPGLLIVFVIFGLVPGVGLIITGSQMATPGANLRSLANTTIVLALLSLLSFGGIFIGAILAFIGAAMAYGAANEFPRQPFYGYPAQPQFPAFPPPPPPHAPPPMAAPQWNTPAWAPPPPAAPGYPSYPSYPQYPAPATFTPLYGDPAPAPVPARVVARPVEQRPAAPPPPPAPAPVSGATEPPAAPPLAPATPMQSFLAKDPNRSFDLEGLNQLDFSDLSKALDADRSLRPQVYETASALIARISSDVADIDTIDDLLRDRTIAWYVDSPNVSTWTDRQTPRWAGLVAETRTAGGARTSALLERLTDLREESAPFQGPARKALADFRARGTEAPAPASSTLPAQVVQAVLDDLAAAPRKAGAATPLLRLSELASKVTVPQVNATLASLFKADAAGPFVILHPSRFPEYEFVFVRPPAPGATGAAVAYEMLCSPADQPLPDAAAGAPAQLPAAFQTPAAPADPTADIWARDAVGDAGWITALGEFERRRERIPTPPSDFRKLPPYFELRKLIVANPDARRTFLATKWRGKPPGLALVAQLLSDRTLTPEVETDAEYLEAELADLERGDPAWKPPTAAWTIAPGVRVARSNDQGVFTYAIA